MLDRQKTFDTVVQHLRAQGQQAIVDGSCCYRTADGLKCAVGALIPDEAYTPDIEGMIAREQEIWSLIPGAEEADADFLYVMQFDLHDGGIKEQFFLSFARYHGLTYTPPQ